MQIWKWRRQLLQSTPVVHLTKSTLLTVAADASTIAELLLPKQPSHDNTMQKKHYLPTIFPRNCPIRTALTFQCKHPLLSSLIINKCKSHWYLPWRWAMQVCSVLHNYKWNHYVMTICVIIPGLPDKLSHNLVMSCETGDEFHIQFFWTSSHLWNLESTSRGGNHHRSVDSARSLAFIR